MKRTTTTVLVAALLLAATVGPTGAVTRSRNADAGEYPAQVGLMVAAFEVSEPFCGGTLVHPSWVLTAAHCVDGALPTDIEVLIGTTRADDGTPRSPIDAIVVHPGFRFPIDDVALLHLSTPATAVPTAVLAYEGMEAVETPGTPAVVTGWGSVSGDESVLEQPVDLQEGDVPVIGDAECDAELNRPGTGGAIPRDDLPDEAYGTLVCAGIGTAESFPEEADSCYGDSGGPLWVTGPDDVLHQIGIVSGGPSCGNSPTYYQSVEAYIPFLEETLGVQLASFTDIPGDGHEQNVERITLAGIAGGLGGGLYGPVLGVTRGQMSTFLARALGLAPVEQGPFTDTAGDPHAANINAVAAAGVAGGFPDGTFRPNDPVTRGQMASFIARARGLQPVAEPRFTDTAGNAHEANINAVALAGIAGGFPDGTYHPLDGVTRGQMATFLAQAFLLTGVQ